MIFLLCLNFIRNILDIIYMSVFLFLFFFLLLFFSELACKLVKQPTYRILFLFLVTLLPITK